MAYVTPYNPYGYNGFQAASYYAQPNMNTMQPMNPPIAPGGMQGQQTNQTMPNAMGQIPQMPTIANAQMPQCGIIWVKDARAAEAYPVAPNTAVALWDENNPIIYFKEAEPSGKVNTKIYQFTDITPNQNPNVQVAMQAQPTPAINKELDALRAEMDDLRAEMEVLKQRNQPAAKTARARKEESKEEAE